MSLSWGPSPVPVAEPLPHRYLVPNDPAQSLLDLTFRDFVREVGARSATPGGGSVAAAVGAMVSMGLGVAWVGGSRGGTRKQAPKVWDPKEWEPVRGIPSHPQDRKSTYLSPGCSTGLHGWPDDLWEAPL